jgi:hypothetical protein
MPPFDSHPPPSFLSGRRRYNSFISLTFLRRPALIPRTLLSDQKISISIEHVLQQFALSFSLSSLSLFSLSISLSSLSLSLSLLPTLLQQRSVSLFLSLARVYLTLIVYLITQVRARFA